MNWQSGATEDRQSISEVCARTGLSARTVRYYEELGLLPGVRRKAGGRRVYGPDELERLRFIQRLKKLGLSLAEIRELNAVHAIGGSTQAMLGRLDELLERRERDLDERIAELLGLREQIGKYRERVRRRVGSRAGKAAAARGGASAPTSGGVRGASIPEQDDGPGTGAAATREAATGRGGAAATRGGDVS